jgi:ubiquinone/menaquinone biosynthesis C-methylase UbiE
VAAQVDPLARHLDRRNDRLDELALLADDREDRAVVIRIGMHVEEARMQLEGSGDCVDRVLLATLREVRNRLEGQHGSYSRPMRDYYDRRAREYDDWYLGTGFFAGRDRRGWDEEVAVLAQVIEALPLARTLDVACGTGFLTRHLRGDVIGLDQSTAMLEEARRRVPHATFVQGDALALPVPNETFDRVFTGHFYGHLEAPARATFLTEARRVAPELVVVDSSREASGQDEEVQERALRDGSRWRVYKRWFTADGLVAELGGGETLHAGRYFVAVRSP